MLWFSVSQTIMATALTPLSIRVISNTLYFAIMCQHLAPIPWDPIILIALGDLSSKVAASTVISAPQKRESTELFKDVGVPRTNLFLTFMVEDMSCGPPRPPPPRVSEQVRDTLAPFFL